MRQCDTEKYENVKLEFTHHNTTVWRAPIRCGFIYLYQSMRNKRWFIDNDLNESAVLEHTPATDAKCPNQIRTWYHYCSTYNLKRIGIIYQNSVTIKHIVIPTKVNLEMRVISVACFQSQLILSQ